VAGQRTPDALMPRVLAGAAKKEDFLWLKRKSCEERSLCQSCKLGVHFDVLCFLEFVLVLAWSVCELKLLSLTFILFYMEMEWDGGLLW
jgi:hypothetical protein